MRISTPPISANSMELAEWLELIALTRENSTSSEADLRALLEGPAGDIAVYEGNQSEQDEALELLVQEVFDELDDRRRWAGRGYPFEIEPLNVLRLKDRLKYAGIAYLLSLLISFLKR